MARAKDHLDSSAAIARPLSALGPAKARIVLALLFIACVWAAIVPDRMHLLPEAGSVAQETTLSPNDTGSGDIALYEAIHRRVADGENYYAAALAEQRERNYPTAPFVTVRLPTMAMVERFVGVPGWRVLGAGLLFGMIGLWIAAWRTRTSLVERGGAGIVMVLCGVGAFGPLAHVLHEVMAGVLLSLGLVFFGTKRWIFGLIAAFCALAIRELAIPFLLLWSAFAAANRSWREFATVIALCCAYGVALGFHADAVAAERLDGDGTSQGWGGLQGPSLPIASLIMFSPLKSMPAWISGPLAVLPLIGWIGLGGKRAIFACLWFVGFAMAVALFARPDNVYWILLVMPLYAA
ncbi:MAG: hypothetical protein WA908_00975, partial [Pontixanthobacter sp.]